MRWKSAATGSSWFSRCHASWARLTAFSRVLGRLGSWKPSGRLWLFNAGEQLPSVRANPAGPWEYEPIDEPCGTCSVSLLCWHLKFRTDECLYSFFSGQSQAKQAALMFQVNMKIEKWTAFALGSHPIRQVRKGDIRRGKLEFVALFRFHDVLSRGDKFF